MLVLRDSGAPVLWRAGPGAPALSGTLTGKMIMAKLVKFILIGVVALVGVGIVAGVLVSLFFDPNDYRGQIAAQVENATGREFAIEGDLSLKIFPWIAIEIGRTTLGNAEGFGDEPMIKFDKATLSVQVLPLITSREVRVGTATLEGFEANLAVAANGRSNWDDLGADDEPESAETAPDDDDSGTTVEGTIALDIGNVRLSDARVTFSDEQAGSSYSLSNVNFSTGRVVEGQPVDIEGSLDFAISPDDISGSYEFDTTVAFADGMQTITLDDLRVRSEVDGVFSQAVDFRLDARSISIDAANERINPGEIDLGALGMSVTADVEPFSYSGSPAAMATVRVADFSLKELLARVDAAVPETADPNALEKVSFEATANLGEDALRLSAMRLVLDDTTMNGSLSVPLSDDGAIVFDLEADSITLDNYLSPPSDEEATSDEATDVGIPVEAIRALQADGSLRLAEAFVGPVRFSDMQVGVRSADGLLRLHPINASFFDGGYSGDVRIDASGAAPGLSVNENIRNVNVASMLQSMYGVKNMTGTINASFVLSGVGPTLSAIASDLDGDMRFELLDGEWQGVDVWQQLRTARALYKREVPPAPRLPARTEFTSITATGTVNDGVFTNDDLLAELPFVRVTGGGTVDLGAQELDYSVQARILREPEFMSSASEDEINDFTEALIPIRISGPLASPSFSPDIEGMFRQEVEQAIEEKTDELKQELFDRLLGGDESTEEEGAGDGADTGREEPKDLEDELKDRLKDIFPR